MASPMEALCISPTTDPDHRSDAKLKEMEKKVVNQSICG